ncbi:glutathione peroxidase, partial [Staphylococcus epidermidis]
VYNYKFGITFPIHAKINVNGEHEHPLYTLLKCKQPGLFGSQIKWNFTKFVVDQQGNIVKRFLPCDNPNQMEKLIRQLLK